MNRTPTTPRYCPTCRAEMRKVSSWAWLCPNQKDQHKGISEETRAIVRNVAGRIDKNCGF